MISNQPITPELLLVEQPTVSQRCPRCNTTVKASTTATGEVVLLKSPYQIKTIFREDGHYFEQVRAWFQHRCPLLKPPTSTYIAVAQ